MRAWDEEIFSSRVLFDPRFGETGRSLCSYSSDHSFHGDFGVEKNCRA